MSGKDVIKLLLCTYGFDRDIKIRYARGKRPHSVITAANTDGVVLDEANAKCVNDAVYKIIACMTANGISPEKTYAKRTLKEVLDDEERSKIYNKGKKKDNGEHNDCGTYE